MQYMSLKVNLSRWLGLCLAPALRERGLLTNREKGTSGIARTFQRSADDELVDNVDVSSEDNEVES